MNQTEFIESKMRDYGGARMDRHKLNSLLTAYQRDVCGQGAEPSDIRELHETKQLNSDQNLKIMGLEQAIDNARDTLQNGGPIESAAKKAWEILDSVRPSSG